MKSLGPLPPPPAVGGQQIVNIDEAKDLVDSVGDTTILKNYPGPGHLQLNGGAIALPALLYQFGVECTAMELMFWHWHAEKVAKKRDHAWGSAIVREAAQVRYSEYGRYGHGR